MFIEPDYWHRPNGLRDWCIFVCYTTSKTNVVRLRRLTYESMAPRLGVTKERVRQVILKEQSFFRSHNGPALKRNVDVLRAIANF